MAYGVIDWFCGGMVATGTRIKQIRTGQAAVRPCLVSVQQFDVTDKSKPLYLDCDVHTVLSAAQCWEEVPQRFEMVTIQQEGPCATACIMITCLPAACGISV
jgi:hypothetical protein